MKRNTKWKKKQCWQKKLIETDRTGQKRKQQGEIETVFEIWDAVVEKWNTKAQYSAVGVKPAVFYIYCKESQEI